MVFSLGNDLLLCPKRKTPLAHRDLTGPATLALMDFFKKNDAVIYLLPPKKIDYSYKWPQIKTPTAHGTGLTSHVSGFM